jgi:hypothetical protein
MRQIPFLKSQFVYKKLFTVKFKGVGTLIKGVPLEEEMTNPFYMINRDGKGSIVRHTSFEAALKEARRLCTLEPSATYDILRSVCTIKLDPQFIEESHDAD